MDRHPLDKRSKGFPNAARHTFERALANAYSIIEGLNHSDIIPIMCSANCLQVDKHNDNGWDQGLLFMNNRSVWYQAPALVYTMLDKVLLDRRFDIDETLVDGNFHYTAMTDGTRISLILMNRADREEEISVHLPFTGAYRFEKTFMTYADDDVNTAQKPDHIHLSHALGKEEDTLSLSLRANTITTVMITPEKMA